MDKLLPVIEISKATDVKNPEPLITNAPDNRLPENASGMDFMEAVIEQSSDKDDIINIEEREIPDEDEVFYEKSAPKINPVDDYPPSSEFPQNTGKRKYVRKAPMSEKQKAHLAKMRDIASEKRRLERERKAKEKEDALIEKAEKKIIEKKKKAEEDSLKNQREEQDKINYKPTPEKVNGFTKQDLDSAVLSAISQYDTLRKQQKKEKKEDERKRMEEEKMRATLARAIHPHQHQHNDPWRNLFT